MSIVGSWREIREQFGRGHKGLRLALFAATDQAFDQGVGRHMHPGVTESGYSFETSYVDGWRFDALYE